MAAQGGADAIDDQVQPVLEGAHAVGGADVAHGGVQVRSGTRCAGRGALGPLMGLRLGLFLSAVKFGLLVEDEAADERDERGQALQGLPGAAAGRLLEGGDAPVEQREAVRQRPGAGDQPGAVAMGQQQRPVGARDLGEPVLPASSGGGRADGEHPWLGQHVGHVVEQVLLVREVPVQGWCLDVQLGGQAAQRQPVQAGLVEQAQRSAGHLITVEAGNPVQRSGHD